MKVCYTDTHYPFICPFRWPYVRSAVPLLYACMCIIVWTWCVHVLLVHVSSVRSNWYSHSWLARDLVQMIVLCQRPFSCTEWWVYQTVADTHNIHMHLRYVDYSGLSASTTYWICTFYTRIEGAYYLTNLHIENMSICLKSFWSYTVGTKMRRINRAYPLRLLSYEWDWIASSFLSP